MEYIVLRINLVSMWYTLWFSGKLFSYTAFVQLHRMSMHTRTTFPLTE